ncbi:MAG: hypothetical protein IPM49_07045 [Flavobacteriales bacterium]|nr:hypothetical protein [Flavobacteriales bacterium]
MEAQLFYKELGRLLYAVAAVDGKVSPKEVDTLKRVVKERLVPVEAGMDHFGSDQAYITEFEFDVLAERNATSEEAYTSFIAYMARHRNDLGGERRDLIYACAHAVARAVHGVGAKEFPLLVDLHRHLG